MAQTFANHSHGFSGTSYEGQIKKNALGFLNSLKVAWKQREEKAKALRSLKKMNAYELHDLGITQGDFQNIVDGSFKRGE
ncbi:MAG: DUF1127 domain-containing protein [Methyloligellaceae bacterium]